MKASLEFNLPEDQNEFDDAVNATKYIAALHDIKNHVRSVWKYGELSDDTYKVVDEIYKHICDVADFV